MNAGVMSVTGNDLNLVGYSGAPWGYVNALGGINSPDTVEWSRVSTGGTEVFLRSTVAVNASTIPIPAEPVGTQLMVNLDRKSMSSIGIYFSGTYRLAPEANGVGTNFALLSPAPVAPWTTEVRPNAAGRTGEEISVPLETNYPASTSWSILNNPGWLRIDNNRIIPGVPGVPIPAIWRPVFGTAMAGTPPGSGTYTINVRATRNAVNKDHTCVLTIITPVRTIISSNASISRDGTLGAVGDTVNLALQATPTPATWVAAGLPPGLSITQEGLIDGTYRRPGAYLASITATATGESYRPSIPFTIRFVITGEAEADNDDAILRVPWLLSQWQITDLQIQARSKVVQSTLFEGGALRMKIGDSVSLGIFFVDAVDSVFELSPSQLRFTVRKADNLEDVLVQKTVAFGSASIQEQTPYYLMEVTTGAAEREIVLEWAEQNTKNEPLVCAADVEWTKDGKVYSSRTFPVRLELDVSRP